MDYHVYPKVKDTVHPSLKSNKLDNLIQYCQQNNILFVDKEFPPNQVSLVGSPTPADYDGQFKVVEWKRAKELFGEGAYDVFRGITPCDIRQGSLGNCYFLCSLASLAEHPKLISRLFDYDTVNDHGIQSVWLNINGIWTRIILDEYFPAYFNGVEYDLAFSKTDQKELWVILLEKAYAKAYGSYWEIIGGDPVHALRDLSGAPYDRVEDFTNLDVAWQKIFEANTKNYILTCFTKSTKVSEEKSETGIVSGHAYSILDVRDIINAKGQPARVLQIRNPWGKFEWNGEYSDKSNLWTPQQRQELNIIAADDGIFWMKLEDFIQFFEGIGILEIIPGYVSNAVKVDNNNLAMVRMQLPQASHITICVDQLDSRTVDNPEYAYSYFRVTIGKLNGKLGITFVDTLLSPERNIFLENKLPAGDYILLVEAYWSSNLVKQFNISTYSENDVELELLPLNPSNFNNAEYYIWKDFAKRNLQAMTTKGARTAGSGNTTASIESYQYQNKKYSSILYAYVNRSDRNAVHESLTYKNKKGFNPVGLHTTEQGAQLIINPQDVDILLFKMDPRSQGFTLSHQITDEEVIPFKFTEDVTALELINSLGGSQPTPDNPNPSLVPRQQKQTEIQDDNVNRKQLKDNLTKMKEDKKRQKDMKKKKLDDERRPVEEERARQKQNKNYNNQESQNLIGQRKGMFGHLFDQQSQLTGGNVQPNYNNNANVQPNLFGGLFGGNSQPSQPGQTGNFFNSNPNTNQGGYGNNKADLFGSLGGGNLADMFGSMNSHNKPQPNPTPNYNNQTGGNGGNYYDNQNSNNNANYGGQGNNEQCVIF